MIIHIISTNQIVKCANRQTFSCESCSLTFLNMKRHAIASLDNHFRTHDNHSRSHTNNCAFIKFVTRKYIFNMFWVSSVIILRLLRHLNTAGSRFACNDTTVHIYQQWLWWRFVPMLRGATGCGKLPKQPLDLLLHFCYSCALGPLDEKYLPWWPLSARWSPVRRYWETGCKVTDSKIFLSFIADISLIHSSN